jgi:hypothetical protein
VFVQPVADNRRPSAATTAGKCLWIGFLNDIFYHRSPSAGPGELSIPFLLDKNPTVVPVGSAGERLGGAARSNSADFIRLDARTVPISRSTGEKTEAQSTAGDHSYRVSVFRCRPRSRRPCEPRTDLQDYAAWEVHPVMKTGNAMNRFIATMRRPKRRRSHYGMNS